MRSVLPCLILCACSNLTQPPTETIQAEPQAADAGRKAGDPSPQQQPPPDLHDPHDHPTPTPEIKGDPETELKIKDLK